jgi:hypothetical protein
MSILSVSGWCRDSFHMTYIGETIVEDHYVPYGMCIGGGDELAFDIDVETGKILNWDPEKVKAKLAELQGGEED